MAADPNDPDAPDREELYGDDIDSPDGWRWAADEQERDEFWNSEK